MSDQIMNKQDVSQALVIPTIPALMFVVVLVLTSSLLSLLFSLVISFRLGDLIARPNPFNNYEIIWPGGTLKDVTDYVRQTSKGHMACYSNAPVAKAYSGLPLDFVPNSEMFDESPQFITCMDDFERGVFGSINIVIRDEQIRELNLFSNTLQQDVLFLYWGAPDSISKMRNGEKLYLHWDRSTYVATATITRPYSVVSLVTVIAKN